MRNENAGPEPVVPPSSPPIATSIASHTTAHAPTSPCSLGSDNLPCQLSRLRVLTQAGKAYANERAVACACLEALWEKRTGASSTPNEGEPSSEGVEEKQESVDSLQAIEPNVVVPNAAVGVVVKEHAHTADEQAHITIHSNKRCDPTQPDYDMSIPPATYEEAVQRADKNEWLEAMKAELQTMKEMNVYVATPLPSNRKAIGCRWVLRSHSSA